MASEKRKLTLSKETLRTLSATALSQVAGGACYSSQYCSYTVNSCGGTLYTGEYPCPPTECQTAGYYPTLCGGPPFNTGGFSTCFTCYGC
jgi:hypothetical protein